MPIDTFGLLEMLLAILGGSLLVFAARWWNP